MSFARLYTNILAIKPDDSTESGGFSATVFERADGQLALAIRGTSGWTDLAEDFTTVYPHGAAYDQIVAMYNWWMQITHVAGTPVPQFTIRSYTGDEEPASPQARFLYSDFDPVVPPGVVTSRHWYVEPAAMVDATGVGVDGHALLADGARIDVTGHSLGGHLAMVFGSLFADEAGQVTAFNAPGFRDTQNNRQFFELLGGTLPTAVGTGTTRNVAGIEGVSYEDSVNIVTGLWSRPGVPVDIAIEDQRGSSEPAEPGSKNHSIMLLTDSLAVYQLLYALDPSLGTQAYRALFDAADHRMHASLEGIVDALQRVLGVDDSLLPAGNDAREELHRAVLALRDDGVAPADRSPLQQHFASLCGNVRILPPDSVSLEDARSDFGVFLSLMTLTPFVLQADADASAALQAAQGTLHAQWLRGAAAVSDQYLLDRARLVQACSAFDSADAPVWFNPSSQIFSDVATGTAFRTQIARDYPDLVPPGHLWFGGKQAESPDGGAGNDHLYGMAGNDTLLAGTGDDYLEGGEGDDTYLLGHATNAGDIHGDTLLDPLGANTLRVQHAADGEFATVSALARLANGLYAEVDAEGRPVNGTRYMLIDSDLVITTTAGNTLTIRDFLLRDGAPLADRNQNAFGIVFDDAAATAPPTDATVATVGTGVDEVRPDAYSREAQQQGGHGWSTTAIRFDAALVGNYTGGDAFGTSGGAFEGGPVADHLSGDAAQNALHGEAGDDLVEGDAGNDYLAGGAGSDTLRGGAGMDVLFGNESFQFIANLLNNTPYWAANPGARDFYLAQHQAQAPDSDVLEGGAGIDFLSGGAYHDVLDGGSEGNHLLGGTGKDTLVGGADVDTIYGDSELNFRLVDDGYPNHHVELEVAFADGTDPVGQYNDLVSAGDGNDAAWGELGNDTLRGEAGNDFLHGDRVDDRAWFDGELAGYAGTGAALEAALHGNDALHGGAGNDSLWGDGGNDALYGGAGADELVGDADAAHLDGTAHGQDTLDGGEGNDELWGYGGNDVLLGGTGDDYLEGDLSTLDAAFHGNDSLRGGAGADTLIGDGGADTLDGGADDDALGGGEGDDRLVGGAGCDYLAGGAGDDTYVLARGDGPLSAQGATESIDDSEGTNTVEFGTGIGVDDIALSLQQAGNLLVVEYGAGDAVIVTGGLGGSVDRFRIGGATYTADALYARNSQDAADQSTATAGADLVGSALSNLLSATGGGATLRGGRGNDTLTGGGGANVYVFESGDGVDQIHDHNGLSSGPNTVRFGAGIAPGDVSLSISAAGDLEVLIADSMDRLVIHNFDRNNALTSAAIERYQFADGTVLTHADLLGDGFVLQGGDAVDSITGSGLPDRIHGGAGGDFLNGGNGDDTLDGGTGNDDLTGGYGNNTYLFGRGDGQDCINGFDDATPGKQNTLRFKAGIASEDLVITGGPGSNPHLQLGIVGTSDTVRIGSFFASDSPTNASNPVQRIEFASGEIWTIADLLARFFAGSAGDDSISGTLDANAVTGLSGHDWIDGRGGDDTLAGGAGNDSLIGGTGSDTYQFDQGDGEDTISGAKAGESETLGLGAGIERGDLGFRGTRAVALTLSGSTDAVVVENAANLSLRFADHSTCVLSHALAGAETAASTASANALALVGNDLDNTLTGDAAANHLTGGRGMDTLIGGAGDDVYVADMYSSYAHSANHAYTWGDARLNNVQDTVVEAAGEGNDTLVAYRVYSASLAANVENLVVDGYLSAPASFSFTVAQDVRRRFTGNALDNVIDATQAGSVGLGAGYTFVSNGAGEEIVLDGGAGADTLVGAALNTRYIVDDAGDVVVAQAAGRSTVESSIDYTLGANVDNLVLTGGAAIAGTGNALANTLDGARNNAVNVLAGGAGNDTYVLGTGDSAVEAAGGGVDTVFAAAAFTLGANLENLSLANTAAPGQHGTGNELDNVIKGTTKTGAATYLYYGKNTLQGDAGNDTLWGEGQDDTLAGGDGDDVLCGDSDALAANHHGNDSLDGGAGDDTLIGHLGDDRYSGFTLSSGNDVLVDAGGSADVVEFAIGSDVNVEKLQFARVGDDLRISADAASALTIRGWYASPESVIEKLIVHRDGSVGGTEQYEYTTAQIQGRADGVNTAPMAMWMINPHTCTGQATVFQVPGNGFLDIESQFSLTYAATLADQSPLPAWLTLDSQTGAFSGTPPPDAVGALSIVVTATDAGGLSASQGFTLQIDPGPISGTEGNDTVTGTAGDDWLVGLGGDDFADGGGGDDTLTGEAGNDTLLGGEGSDYLSGDDGNDSLDGGAGDDELRGGAGADVYVVDSTRDELYEADIEEDDGAIDEVRASVSYTLLDQLENLTLTGAGALNGTGTAAANVLAGNSGNNTLTGLGGNDTLDGGSAGTDSLRGGTGNDTYFVDRSSGITVTENANEGADTVQASVTHTLANNVENLVLTGTGAINGTGNSLANTLTGNSGDNSLSGGTGNDTMLGGAGNDTYVIDAAGDLVTENANEGMDLVQSSVTHTLSGNVENLRLAGSSTIHGTGNSLDNLLVGNTGNNSLSGAAGNDSLDGGSGNDTMVGGTGNDIFVVAQTGDVTAESASEGTDTIQSSITRTLAANIELLFLTGTGAINGKGNALANLLRGNTGNNTLAGAGGTDILEGDAGNDTLSNTTGKTLLNGGAGTDTLTGTAHNDLLIGGTGNDALTTGSGADIIVFNKGDGQDTVASSTMRDNTLSIGGGATYADLVFQKSGNNLILKVGASDRITFTNYYASSANRSIGTLQIVLEGSSDYNAGSPDVMYNKKVETFDFEGLVAAFDGTGLTTWSLGNALAARYLSGSDTAAIGGDIAYRYGLAGSLSDLSFTPAIGLLAAGGFGTGAQALQALASLQDSTPRLN